MNWLHFLLEAEKWEIHRIEGQKTNGKGKRKFHSITGQEGPQGEQKYTSTLSLTSVLDGRGWLTPIPSRFTPHPNKINGTHCTGGWVGPGAGLDRCRKFRPHRDSIPGPSSPWPVTIPIMLPGPDRLVFKYLLKSSLSIGHVQDKKTLTSWQ
jgi:hypothetical protein